MKFYKGLPMLRHLGVPSYTNIKLYFTIIASSINFNILLQIKECSTPSMYIFIHLPQYHKVNKYSISEYKFIYHLKYSNNTYIFFVILPTIVIK